MENYTPKTNAADAARKCNKVGEVTLELREITPRMAALMLMSNFEGNRKIRKSAVRTYAHDMREGRWEPTTNNVIQIGTDGKVYDGQHRLNAVILANTTVPMYVNLKADPSEYMTYDNGATRSESDVVNVTNAIQSQAVSKFIYAFDRGTSPIVTTFAFNRIDGTTTPTKAQTREIMIQRDDEIQPLIKAGYRMSTAVGAGSRNDYAKALYAISKLCDPIFIEEFVDEVSREVSLDKTIISMKSAIVKKALKKTDARKVSVNGFWLMMTIMKAYESFLSGTCITRFTRQDEWAKEYDKRLKEWRKANQKEA